MANQRLSDLMSSIQASGLDALALNPGPSLTYLTGLHFHLSERPVLAYFAAGFPPAIILPELELGKLESLPFEIKAFPYGEDPQSWKETFMQAGRSLKLEGRAVGVEPRSIRLLEYRYVQALTGKAKSRDASALVGALRQCKDVEETSAIRRAVIVAQQALESTLPFIKIGLSEKEIAAELVVQLLRGGSEPELPFLPIVSGGPNSANPHAVPSERKLQAGDLLVVDWGAAVDGYISDLTRTFAVGDVEAEYRKIHQVVLEFNAAGRAAGKAGLPCSAVDAASRQVIEKSGYGQYFTHRTGHGIGMEAHEDPYMRAGNPQLLEPGMTYTVEPGIYLPGRNGVRIEDNMVITPGGADCLSDMDRGLRQVG